MLAAYDHHYEIVIFLLPLLPDADIAKMDAFTNVSTSTAKSRKKQKPAQPKKKQEQTTGNGKPLPKKTRAKPATSPTKTDNVGTPLKPTAFSIYDLDKVKMPSNEAIFAETDIKSPEIKMATSLSDQVVTPKTGVSNGFSESDRIKVKRKKKHSISDSDNVETPSKKAETENTDDISEPKPTDTPCKKKTKKDVKVSKLVILETPSWVTDPEDAIQKLRCSSDELSESNSSKQSECVVPSKTDETKAKKDKSKKVKLVESVGVDTSIKVVTEDATGSLASGQSEINQVLDFNPAETPCKKAKSKKSKKSKELQEPGDVAVPSGECQIKDQTETLLPSVEEEKNVVGSEPVEKQSKKAKKSLLESNETETPSTKMETPATTSILEPLSSEMTPKKSKTKKRSEVNQAVVDVGEGEATKSSSSKSDHTVTPLKKSKRKRTESSGENVTSSVTEHVSKSSPECDNSAVDNSLVAAGNSTENQVQESVSAVEEEGAPEPKKRKKKKKEKKKNESCENVEEIPPTPPAEEFAESLPSSEKKKSKT